jgi:uncharacterized membrane protein YfcA
MILVTLPLGALGSILAVLVPVTVLKIGYGVAMLGLAYPLLSDHPQPARADIPVEANPTAPTWSQPFTRQAATFPVPVAAATSTVIVARNSWPALRARTW